LTALADTSAWVWSRKPAHAELRHEFDAALVDGDVATCDMVRIELLYSARNAQEFAEIRSELAALADCPIAKDQWRRALWVYEQLSKQGGAHQRSVRHADLLIAAAAEAAELPVLHYDEDFDRIADVTGQATRWLAPRGTLG
jgi:predicted nucleic acid-binding protein